MTCLWKFPRPAWVKSKSLIFVFGNEKIEMRRCPPSLSAAAAYQRAPHFFSHRMKNGGEKKTLCSFFFSFVFYLRLTNDLCQILSAGITNVLIERARREERGVMVEERGVMWGRGIWFERLAEKGISFDGDALNLPHHVTAVCESYSSMRWRETAGISQDLLVMAALFLM